MLLAAACSSGSSLLGPDGGGSVLGPDVLRIGIEGPDTLDPADAEVASQADLVMADLLFDTLTTLDPVSGEPQAGLAGEWSVDDTLSEWRFELREGVEFHDGAALTADDVVFTVQRVAARAAVSPVGSALSVLQGFSAFLDGTAPELAGVRAEDAQTVLFSLTEPFADLPVVLASPVLGVVPAERVSGDQRAWVAEPVGSGPLEYEGESGGVWQLRPAPGSELQVAGVDVHTYDTRDAAYQALAAGLLDWAQVGPGQVEEAVARFGESVTQPSLGELFYAFNLADPRYGDARLREAVVAAVDRDAVVAQVYGSTMVPFSGVVPPGVPGSSDDPCGTPCVFDPERARALLAEAYPDGVIPSVSIDVADDPTQQEVASLVSTALQAVGIPSEVRVFDTEGYAAAVEAGDVGLFRLGWIGGYESAGAFLDPLFSSGSPDDVSSFAVAEVDAGLEQARSTADFAARMQEYAAVEAQVMARVPVLPLGQFQWTSVATQRVQGLDVGLDGTFDVTAVSLAPPPASASG